MFQTLPRVVPDSELRPSTGPSPRLQWPVARDRRPGKDAAQPPSLPPHQALRLNRMPRPRCQVPICKSCPAAFPLSAFSCPPQVERLAVGTAGPADEEVKGPHNALAVRLRQRDPGRSIVQASWAGCRMGRCSPWLQRQATWHTARNVWGQGGTPTSERLRALWPCHTCRASGCNTCCWRGTRSRLDGLLWEVCSGHQVSCRNPDAQRRMKQSGQVAAKR